MDNLVLVVALTVCIIAVLGVMVFLALRAAVQFLTQHWVGVIVTVVSILALVLAGWEWFLAILVIGATVTAIRWLLRKKD